MTSEIRHYGHLIDGRQENPTEPALDRIGPATGKVVARYANGSAADAERAVTATRKAFFEGSWPGLPGLEKAAVLNRWAEAIDREAERLTMIEVEEVGKPLVQARGDIAGAANHIRLAASLAATLHGSAYTNLGDSYTGFLVREPVGVVGMILPWNFPAFIFAQKVPYALAAGCTVVVKPSEWTSGTALEMAALALEAGLPSGALNIVTGEGMPVGQALVHSEEVDLLSFTGSTATGARIIDGQKSNFKRIALELGGKGAMIVFPDADLEEAVEGAVFGAFFAAGEECGSTSRLLVHEEIADQFVAQVATRMEELVVGDPFEETTDIGALIHPNHVEKVTACIDRGHRDGATLRGGTLIEGPALLMKPALLDEVEAGNSAFREEIFGPVLTVTRFGSEREAIALANDTTYGLSNAVWSANIDTCWRVSRALRSGTVWINTTVDGSPQLPYGGYLASGHGREGGQAGIEEFTEIKAVHMRTGRRAPVFSRPEVPAA